MFYTWFGGRYTDLSKFNSIILQDTNLGDNTLQMRLHYTCELEAIGDAIGSKGRNHTVQIFYIINTGLILYSIKWVRFLNPVQYTINK